MLTRGRSAALVLLLTLLGPAGCLSAGPGSVSSPAALAASSTGSRAAAVAAPAEPAETLPPQSLGPETPEIPTAESPNAPIGDAVPPPPRTSAFATIMPSVDWAAAELARRGFTRDPGRRAVVLDPGHGGPEVGVSIHNNGSSNPAEAGTEVWYAPDRPFGDKSQRLAQGVLDGVLQELREAGYDSPDRGLRNGSQFRVFQGRSFPLFVLGGPREGLSPSRGTRMPGVLGEALFLSNTGEAALLARDDILEAIARGYHRGILGYFAEAPEWSLLSPLTR